MVERGRVQPRHLVEHAEVGDVVGYCSRGIRQPGQVLNIPTGVNKGDPRVFHTESLTKREEEAGGRGASG